MYRAQRPLSFTCTFKVVQPWVCNKTAKIWHSLYCPLYRTYSSGWILSIFGTDERVCRQIWSLTLTYAFKVIQQWLCNKADKIWHVLPFPLYSTYISRSIPSIFFTMTSSNGNSFHITGPLCGEFTDHRWSGALIFFIFAWINGWVNNHETGDLRRHGAHYDVTVMGILRTG